jgi:ParB family chromosome partitioning protein
VLGLLQPPHVKVIADGKYQLIDGERRWRAAKRAGLSEILCDLWPADTKPGETKLAGFALNEERKAAGCVHVARGLRDIKNELGLTHEDLAKRAGMPLDRIKTYFSLFGASDELLIFFEHQDLPLKLAVEFVRYEKATSEAKARRLTAQHLREPFSCQDIALLRRRAESRPAGQSDTTDDKTSPAPRLTSSAALVARFGRFLERDRASALSAIRALLTPLGYDLVNIDGAPEGSES